MQKSKLSKIRKRLPPSDALVKTTLTNGYQICKACADLILNGEVAYSGESIPGVRVYVHDKCKARLPVQISAVVKEEKGRALRTNGQAHPSGFADFKGMSLPTMTFLSAGDCT